MAARCGSQFSSVFTSFSSQSRPKISSKVSLSVKLFGTQLYSTEQQGNFKVSLCRSIPTKLKAVKRLTKRRCNLSTSSEDVPQHTDVEPDASDQDKDNNLAKDVSSTKSSYVYSEGAVGKPGLISFHSYPYKQEVNILEYRTRSNQNNVLWFVGPAVLVASYVFPSLYLRRILSTIFEDSLLTGKKAIDSDLSPSSIDSAPSPVDGSPLFSPTQILSPAVPPSSSLRRLSRIFVNFT